MIIFFAICFTLCYIMALAYVKKREKKTDEFCETPKPSKKEVLLAIMAVISLAMILLIGIAMIVVQALGADSNTTTLNREYIPVKSEKIKVYVTTDSELCFFDDGYGHTYYIPKNTATVETFPDSDLRITSVTKVTQRKTPSRITKFLLDFGIFSGDDGEIIETYELSIPESKVIPIARASDAFSVQIAVPFEEES